MKRNLKKRVWPAETGSQQKNTDKPSSMEGVIGLTRSVNLTLWDKSVCFYETAVILHIHNESSKETKKEPKFNYCHQLKGLLVWRHLLLFFNAQLRRLAVVKVMGCLGALTLPFDRERRQRIFCHHHLRSHLDGGKPFCQEKWQDKNSPVFVCFAKLRNALPLSLFCFFTPQLSKVWTQLLLQRFYSTIFHMLLIDWRYHTTK